MEIQGTIVQVLPLQSGVGKSSGKEWKKQEYILNTSEDSKYPTKVCLALWGDNVDKFASLMVVGNQIVAQIDIESREFNGRWYTEVRAWRVDGPFVQQGAQPQQGGYQAPQPVATQQEQPAGLGRADDLPF